MSTQKDSTTTLRANMSHETEQRRNAATMRFMNRIAEVATEYGQPEHAAWAKRNAEILRGKLPA